MRDIKEFGAVGNGISVETEVIQTAIDECTKTGEILKISKGIYKTEKLREWL